ncbi:sugar transferase [Holdemania massiliensis]|uniref:sugar transferase n=1 Tax=Holdemania massiliensis TaxID=1468449 RepID=UPI003521CF71
MYKHFVKRLLDIILSTIGIVVLALPMLIVAIMIKIDSPGPVLFKQRRIGLHKREFVILKFRSMPVSAPSNVATHQLDVNAIQMSKFQKAIRKLSIDELPQLYNIWLGQLSCCGPRPALYNQANLVAERDKYGANDVKPGLTGWAQINGRDELEIEVKAKLDGEYTAALNAGYFKGFAMDCCCFIGTVLSVIRSDGVVEGGTGEMKKQEELKEVSIEGDVVHK